MSDKYTREYPIKLQQLQVEKAHLSDEYRRLNKEIEIINNRILEINLEMSKMRC